MFAKSPRTLIPRAICAIRGKRKGNIAEILQNPRSILLVKQSERLGNIILLNAAISGLKSTYPNIEIDLLLPAIFTDVMAANGCISRIIPVFKRKYITRPWQLLNLLSILRSKKYDLAIDCSDVNSHSSTGAAYTLLSGARLTAGWKMSERRIFDIEIDRFSDRLHASQMYQELISGIFGRKIVGSPFIGEHLQKSANDLIGINCGGRGTKRWPLKNFIAVGEILGRQGFRVEFILGPEEERLRGSLKGNLPAGCILPALLPLKDLLKKMRSYRLFISSDTGPMHMAWSLGVPVIAIFIDSEMYKFRPLSPGSEAIDGTKGISPDELAGYAIRSLRSGVMSA